MNILVTGQSQIKFTFLGRHLGTIKKPIKENINLDNPNLSWKRNIDLPGDLDLVLEAVKEKTAIKIIAHITLFGAPIFSHTEEVVKVDGVHTFKLPEFNRFGIKVTDVKITLSL
jgi:hypothetical protein